MSNELYSQLISLVNLKSIEVKSLNCEKNIDFNHRGELLDVAVNYNINEVMRRDLEVRIPCEFSLVVFYNEEKTEKDVNSITFEDTSLKISFELLLDYNFMVTDDTTDVNTLFSKELLFEFADKNVPINAWPYARELISNMTMRMGFPPLFIPPYKNIPKI